MIANSYYEKALANFKSAKILFRIALTDEEQLNQAAYHISQSLKLAIKHILGTNGIPIQKTHDIDQLIMCANEHNVDLYLTPYLLEKSDVISIWETKTRYTLGFLVDVNRISKTIEELENYFSILSKKLNY